MEFEKEATMTKNDLLKHLYTEQFKQDEMQDAMRRARLIPIIIGVAIIVILVFVALANAQQISQPIYLTASWYSMESLKREGTYKLTKGVMANGQLFRNEGFTCATRLFPLGARLRIIHVKSGRYVFVKVTDRIGKRFANKRIDLSKAAFSKIADLNDGLCRVRIEVIND